MTIFCDRDNRWYLGFLCGLLLLAVGLGAIFSWQLGQAAQAVLVAREEMVAAVLLAEGVPETTVAKAFAEENGHSAAAAALLEKIGHDRATSPLLFPALRDQMENAYGVTLIGTLCIGALAIAAAFVFLRRQERRYLTAAEKIAAYAAGDFSVRLPQNENGALAQLFAAVEELARSLAAKSENEQRVKDFLKSMISDISHQVKTPLAALRMYNEITIAEPENVTTVRDFAAKSERALDKLEQLIQSLLRLTRLDAGSVVFAREPVALSALVARALEPFSARAEREHKTMTVTGDDETVLLCDAAWTEEAISNLVKNALDHTQTGGHIRISWETGPALLRLSVSDDGAGISAEDIHHIFKRFYRSTTSSGSGVGLGLPIAKAIVEGQGGTLSVVSASGDGATFTMAFPCG